jgi:enamine deaminase RidA (YjgF/YER057c/UK114 family)
LKTSRNPDAIHPPLTTYAHQIEITGAERLLILSGQVGMRPDGTISSDPIEQIDVAMSNVVANLAAAEMTHSDIVKLTIYLVGEMNGPRRRETIANHLRGHNPCMTLVYVAALAAPEYRVEIDAWASASA